MSAHMVSRPAELWAVAEFLDAAAVELAIARRKLDIHSRAGLGLLVG